MPASCSLEMSLNQAARPRLERAPPHSVGILPKGCGSAAAGSGQVGGTQAKKLSSSRLLNPLIQPS